MRRILPLVHRREKRREDIAPRGLIGGARFGQQVDQRLTFLTDDEENPIVWDDSSNSGGILLD